MIVIRIGAVLVLLVMAMALVAPILSTHGQDAADKDIGKTPRQVLPNQMLDELVHGSSPFPGRAGGAVIGSLERRLDVVTARQQYVLEQISALSEMREHVASTSREAEDLDRRCTELENRVNDHMKVTGTEPTSIALLQAQMDGLLKALNWLAAGVGSLALSIIGYVIKGRIDRRKR